MSAYITYPLQSDVIELDIDSVTRNLYFDVVTSEKQQFSSETTEYAVEKGANITDHVRTNPDAVTLEVIVSNEPISDDPQNALGAFVGSMPISPQSFSPPTNTGTVLQTLSPQGIAQGVLAGSGIGLPKPLPTSAQVLQFASISQDRPSDVKQLLISLKEKGTLLHVVTNDVDFDNMVLTDISDDKSVDTGTAFKGTLTFKRLRIVETQVVTAPKLARAVVSKPKGVRQPIYTIVTTKRQSVASYLEGKGEQAGWFPSLVHR